VHGFIHHIEFTTNQTFGFISSADKIDISYSLVAKESTILLEISSNEFMDLPEKLINILYANLTKVLSSNIGRFLQSIAENTTSRKQFIDYIEKNETQKSQVVSSSFVNDVLAKIPKLPSYTNDILLRLGDENVSTQEIVKTIQNDPSLGGIILKSVNSAYYGLSGKIADIYHAVVYLGFNNVSQLILQKGINSILPGEKEFIDIQIKSGMVAILSQEIAVLLNNSSPMISTTIGLLHNIGNIVIALLKRKNPHLCEVFELFDDAAIGAQLLQNWGVPEKVSTVILHQKKPEYTPPELFDHEYRNDIATLYLAKVCYGMLIGMDMPSMIFVKDYLSILGIHSPDAKHFYSNAIVPALLKNQRKFPENVRQILRQKLGSERTEQD
jgi:HD-like signal output (HDOD) protein